jgi:hypothetical protein
MTALDLYDATPESVNGTAEFDYQGIHVELTEPDHTTRIEYVLRARFVCPLDHPESPTMYQLAKDYVEMYLSETTNNDACHVTIDERSAHHEAGDAFRVEVIVTILDYLT